MEHSVHFLRVPEAEVRGGLRDRASFAELMSRLCDACFTDMLHTVEQLAFSDRPSRLLEQLQLMAEVNGGP